MYFAYGILTEPSGALYLLSIFYTRKEVATRIAILYTGNIFATAFAGLIAIVLFKMDGIAGLEGWRWLFIIQGILTFVVAVVGTHFLPDDPSVTRWLTPEERILAHERIKRDTVDDQGKISTIKGLKEALSDYRVWIFVFMQHMHLASNGFKNFVRVVDCHHRFLLISFLVPQCCSRSWLRSNHHPCVDLPTSAYPAIEISQSYTNNAFL